ncbi:MAG: hypothetical protein AAGA56_29970 [Myxococcota bacterium]
MDTIDTKAIARLGLFSAAVLTGGLVVLPGCSSTASEICDLVCECQRCSDRAREECENNYKAQEERASAFECEADYEAYSDCIIDNPECDDDDPNGQLLPAKRFDADDCDDELADLNECIADASDILGEGSGSGTGTTTGTSTDTGTGTGGSFDNAAACNAWLNNTVCGDFDLSTAVNCDALGTAQCDISPYFSCLTENFTCNDGIPDTTGFTNCASLASCP